MKKRTGIIGMAALILLAALLTVCGMVGSLRVKAAASSESGLSVVYAGKGDVIKFTLTLPQDDRAKCSDGAVRLYALRPEMPDGELSGLTPIVSLPVSDTVTHSMSLESAGSSMLLMRYQAAALQSDGTLLPLTPAVFPTNMEEWEKTSVPFREASSKKGLQIQMIADAQELGVAHTVLNVPAEEYLSDTATAFPVSFDGTTCYLSEKAMTLLDFKVKTMSEAGIRVYLRLLPASNDLMADIDRFCALAHGLSERYTREDALYGFAASFLVGYEVNENLPGWESEAQAVDAYVYLFRAVDTAVRTAYPEARLYLPLSNRYRLSATESYEQDGIIGASAFLTSFAGTIRIGGDLPYRIAVDPYPSDRLLTDFWNDPKALPTSETQYVTMQNLEVLLGKLEEEEFRYKGETRKVLISEFGVSGGYQSEQETTQAAAIAYAYLKAAMDDRVEAIIFHRHVDNDAENQMYFGLWSENAADGSLATPQSRKEAYHVFKFMDTDCMQETDMAQSVTAFAPGVIGVSSFEDLLPGFDWNKAIGRTLIEAVGSEESGKKGINLSYLYDFSRGSLFRFYPTDNTAYIEIRDDVLYAQAYYDTPHEYMGIGAYQMTPYRLKDASSMVLTLRVDAPEPVAEADVMLRLTGTSDGQAIVYEGVARIPTGVQKTLTFDLNDISDAKTVIDNLKIWTRASDEAVYSGDWSVSLSGVQIGEEKSGTWLMGLLGILILIAGIGVILYVIRFIRLRVRAHRYKKLTKERAEKQERRIADQKEREKKRILAEKEAKAAAARAEAGRATGNEAAISRQRAQAQRIAKEVLPASGSSAAVSRPTGTQTAGRHAPEMAQNARRTVSIGDSVYSSPKPSNTGERLQTAQRDVTRQTTESRPTMTQTPTARPAAARRMPDAGRPASSNGAAANNGAEILRTPRPAAHIASRTPSVTAQPAEPVGKPPVRTVTGAAPVSKANPNPAPRMAAPTPRPVRRAQRMPGSSDNKDE